MTSAPRRRSPSGCSPPRCSAADTRRDLAVDAADEAIDIAGDGRGVAVVVCTAPTAEELAPDGDGARRRIAGRRRPGKPRKPAAARTEDRGKTVEQLLAYLAGGHELRGRGTGMGLARKRVVSGAGFLLGHQDDLVVERMTGAESLNCIRYALLVRRLRDIDEVDIVLKEFEKDIVGVVGKFGRQKGEACGYRAESAGDAARRRKDRVDEARRVGRAVIGAVFGRDRDRRPAIDGQRTVHIDIVVVDAGPVDERKPRAVIHLDFVDRARGKDEIARGDHRADRIAGCEDAAIADRHVFEIAGAAEASAAGNLNVPAQCAVDDERAARYLRRSLEGKIVARQPRDAGELHDGPEARNDGGKNVIERGVVEDQRSVAAIDTAEIDRGDIERSRADGGGALGGTDVDLDRCRVFMLCDHYDAAPRRRRGRRHHSTPRCGHRHRRCRRGQCPCSTGKPNPRRRP